jgi:hypothetical protein
MDGESEIVKVIGEVAHRLGCVAESVKNQDRAVGGADPNDRSGALDDTVHAERETAEHRTLGTQSDGATHGPPDRDDREQSEEAHSIDPAAAMPLERFTGSPTEAQY